MKQLTFNFVLKALEQIKQVLKPLKEVVKSALKKVQVKLGDFTGDCQVVTVTHGVTVATKYVPEALFLTMDKQQLIEHVLQHELDV